MDLIDCRTRPVGVRDAFVVAAHRFSDPCGDEERLTQVRAAYADWLRKLIVDGRYLGWLAESGGQVVAGAGAVLLDWGATWADPNPAKARLANVFTAPECRRLGLATRLVSQTLATLRDRGIRSVSLSATEAAQGLYAALGFQRRGGEFGITLS